MKKYLAEMVGTFVLTLLGCGTAVSLACGSDTASVVGTAFAFGLAVVAVVLHEVARLEGLDGGLRPHRHEDRRLNRPVVGP